MSLFFTFFFHLIFLNELWKPLFCFSFILYHELYHYHYNIDSRRTHTTCVHMHCQLSCALHYGALQTVFGVNLYSECRNGTQLGLIWHHSLAVGRNEGRCSISASEELAHSTSKQRTVTLKIWTGLLAEQEISLGIRNGTKCGTQKCADHNSNTHKQQGYFTTPNHTNNQ